MKNRMGRYHSHTEVDSEGTWAISYGDMVTLLLTFFIIFFAADKYQLQKKLRLDVKQRQDVMTRTVASDVEESLKSEAFKKIQVEGKVHKDGNKVYIEFSGVSFFPSGKTELTQSGQKALSEFYKVFAPHVGNYSISVRAFTDHRKVKLDGRGFKDNLELSALRSVSVMRHLQWSGVPLKAMRIAGYGEYPWISELEALSRTPADSSHGNPESIAVSQESLKLNPKMLRKEKKKLESLARTTILVIEPKEEL